MSTVDPAAPRTPPRAAGWLARQSPGLQRVVRNVGWLGLEQMVRLATGLVVGIYVARQLAPIGYGTTG